MRVVLCQNLEVSEGLVNGSQGTIKRFEACELDYLPTHLGGHTCEGKPIRPIGGPHAIYQQHRIRNFASKNSNSGGELPLWPVVEFDNGQERTIYADCCVEEYSDNEVYSLVSRTQVLLMAGYAMTIHKAQVENPPIHCFRHSSNGTRV
jgi:ATP-dependent DNA helicase PIF1